MTRKLKMANVGNGLHVEIYTRARKIHPTDRRLVLDYGGNNNLTKNYLEGHFVLSHFHKDHYNGFLKGDMHLHFPFFYYPAMPRFSDNRHFFLALFAMNAYLSIEKDRPLQIGLFNIIKQHLCFAFGTTRFIPLSKGDKVRVAGQLVEVLWPPAEITSLQTNSRIKKALEDFREAAAVEPQLSMIYEYALGLSEENLPKMSGETKEEWKENNQNDWDEFDTEQTEALGSEGDRYELEKNLHQFNEDSASNTESEKSHFEGKQAIIQQANDSLRSAANDMSLAFCIKNSLLFLGDLETAQIETVANELVAANRKKFKVIIAAHHGTHWSDALLQLKSDYCLASVGSLARYLKNGYKKITTNFVTTQGDSNIYLRF